MGFCRFLPLLQDDGDGVWENGILWDLGERNIGRIIMSYL